MTTRELRENGLEELAYDLALRKTKQAKLPPRPDPPPPGIFVPETRGGGNGIRKRR